MKIVSSVVYFVNDVQACKQWLEQLLGITPYRDEITFVGFKVGTFEIGIHQADDKSGNSLGQQVCYWATSDIYVSIQKFEQHGAKLYRQPLTLESGDIVCQLKTPLGIIGLKQNSNFS